MIRFITVPLNDPVMIIYHSKLLLQPQNRQIFRLASLSAATVSGAAGKTLSGFDDNPEIFPVGGSPL